MYKSAVKAKEKDVFRELKLLENKSKIEIYKKYFQTQKGGYGEGDMFLGLTVPQQRAIAGKYYKQISFSETEKLLKNKFHEARFTALAILKNKYTDKNSSKEDKKKIITIYLKNHKYINNWDLVDTSAPYISGEYWYDNPSDDLWKFAKSKNLWQERIAVISCFYFIKRGRFDEILSLAKYFLDHKHDLMHKAVGWMLRETGKADIDVLCGFLDKYHKKMPRTMLRYSIEKFSPKRRKHYMEK